MSPGRTALDRVVDDAGGPAILDLLGSRLPGADLTTLLLAAFRRRAAGLTPAGVLRRYLADHFAAPAQVPFRSLRRAEDALLSALPDEVEVLALSPVVPLGTHSAVATVDQNKVVSTIRSSEVAADPTNGLALEAAARRRVAAATQEVRLAAIQRVVRAQRSAAAARFAHFTLLGMVTAGRDTGNLAFERQHATEHLRVLADAMRAAGARHTQVRLTVLEPRYAPVAESVHNALSGRADLDVVDDPGRASGHGYYTGFCAKVFTTLAGEPFEVADGGFVDWTQKLLGNRKERLLISGIGVDRLALAIGSP